MNLALKYRPSTFDDITGQRLTAIVLKRMVETGQVPNGLLLLGPSGTGKTTAARIIASALDADAIEIDGASRGGVAEVRALIDSLRYGHAGEHRVVIVDEAQSITREGFNAFLKTLEEPPSGTIFVFCTTEPEKIPGTVLTRLIEFEFRRVSPADIVDRLLFVAEQEGITLPEDLIADIAQRSDGSVRSALMLLEQAHHASISTVEEFRELLGVYDSGPRLIAAIVLGDRAKAFKVLDAEIQTVGHPSVVVSQIVRVLRDIMVIHGGGELELTGQALAIRQTLAARADPDRVYAAARVMWDLTTKIRFSEDPRGNLELAVMLMLDSYTAGSDRSPVTPEPPRKLSLAEIQRKIQT